MKSRSENIRDAVRNSERYVRPRELIGALVCGVVRTGRADALLPTVKDAELLRVVRAMLPVADFSTLEGHALHVYGGCYEPRSLPRYLKRHRKWLRSIVRAAQTPETANPAESRVRIQ